MNHVIRYGLVALGVGGVVSGAIAASPGIAEAIADTSSAVTSASSVATGSEIAGVTPPMSSGAVSVPVTDVRVALAGSPTTARSRPTITSEARSERHAVYRAALAKELGVSPERLQQAEQKAREQVFVARLDERVKQGAITQEQADALKKAAKDGKFDEVVKSQMRARLEASLKGQVDAGLITQAQADAMLNRFDDGPRGMFPRRRGHRGHGGPGMGMMPPVP